MSRRATLDDSALFRRWRSLSMMPGAYDDELLVPKRRSEAFNRFSTIQEEDDSDVWTLPPPSPAQELESMNVTLRDIEEHAAHASNYPKPSMISLRSVSGLSICSSDSMSSLLSDLDESIASWQTGSDESSQSLRSLRKRKTPRRDSLRDIRTKQSEAQLQLCYEQSTLPYLDDSIYSAFRPPALKPRNPRRPLRQTL